MRLEAPRCDRERVVMVSSWARVVRHRLPPCPLRRTLGGLLARLADLVESVGWSAAADQADGASHLLDVLVGSSDQDLTRWSQIFDAEEPFELSAGLAHESCSSWLASRRAAWPGHPSQ